jgi:AhpD family alkylhydroperoxidase
MHSRIDYDAVAPELPPLVRSLDDYVRKSGIERSLVNLVKLRASLLNGCAYCIDMHTKVARSVGETEQRLYGLGAWRETPFYSDRERAALAWTETVTLVSADQVPDTAYAEARGQFSERELVDLTAAIVAINAWNRLAIAFRKVPGSFQLPAGAARAQASESR